MAQQLVGYTYNGIPVPNAYLRITSVSVMRAGTSMASVDSAQVYWLIYADKTSRMNGVPPISAGSATFADATGDPQFTNNFKYPPTTAEANLSAFALLYTQAYGAIKQNVQTSSMLQNSTEV